jgi:hypothetical protein
MTNETLLAIINSDSPEAADAIAVLPLDEQTKVLTNGGIVTMARGKAPNGKNCHLICKIDSSQATKFFAVTDEGFEQPVPRGHVGQVLAMLAK